VRCSFHSLTHSLTLARSGEELIINCNSIKSHLWSNFKKITCLSFSLFTTFCDRLATFVRTSSTVGIVLSMKADYIIVRSQE